MKKISNGVNFKSQSGFTPTPENPVSKREHERLNKARRATPQNLKYKALVWGFTLIEILVYVGVFVVIVGILSGFIAWVYRSNIKAQAMRETLHNSRRAMEIMTYEIKEAKSIYIPTTTSTQLSLETLHYLPGGESSAYIDFFLCGTQLCLKKESQPPIALTSDKVVVKSLSFNVTTTTPSVQINLELEYKHPSDRPEYRASVAATSTASLRTY